MVSTRQGIELISMTHLLARLLLVLYLDNKSTKNLMKNTLDIDEFNRKLSFVQSK